MIFPRLTSLLLLLGVATTHADTDPDFGPWEIIIDNADTIESDREAFATHHIILGPSLIDADSMTRFITQVNPAFSADIAEAYLRLGDTYGIKGDIALCQAIIETGWFTFTGGTAVTADQHNYCGLGVIRRGHRGASFATIDDGVRAHLQHLYAYATAAPLPNGEPQLDPRFRMVARGCATTWHDLNGRWAANPAYGQQILDVYSRMLSFSQTDSIK